MVDLFKMSDDKKKRGVVPSGYVNFYLGRCSGLNLIKTRRTNGYKSSRMVMEGRDEGVILTQGDGVCSLVRQD